VTFTPNEIIEGKLRWLSGLLSKFLGKSIMNTDALAALLIHWNSYNVDSCVFGTLLGIGVNRGQTRD
jgi:hypothetical protein